MNAHGDVVVLVDVVVEVLVVLAGCPAVHAGSLTLLPLQIRL